MKYRKDFVTNSSSSSFIAVFGAEVDKEQAEQSVQFYKDNIFTGKYLKEHWDELKCDYTSYWLDVDPFPAIEHIDEDKLYFAYCSSCELTEDETHSEYEGYDEEEVSAHYDYVDKQLKSLNGFELKYESWQGRDG